MGEFIFCVVLSLFFSIMMVAGWFTTNVFLGDESVRIYPCIVLAIIIICLVLHCIVLYKRLPSEDKKKKLVDVFKLREKNTQKLLITVAVTSLYFYLLDILGFVILTPLIVIWYMFILGERKWWKHILISILLVMVVYSVFVYGLGIRLPRGIGIFREISLALEYLF